MSAPNVKTGQNPVQYTENRAQVIELSWDKVSCTVYCINLSFMRKLGYDTFLTILCLILTSTITPEKS